MVLRDGQEAHSIESHFAATPGLFRYPLNGFVVTLSLMLREGGGLTFAVRVTRQIHVDDGVSRKIERVFDHLKAIDEYDNTMVIFFSDNGANGHPRTAYPGQTDEYLNSFDNSLPNRGLKNSYIDMGPGWAQASMAPSRMFKAFTAEGGIRAPFVVKLPGAMSNAGTMNHSFFHVRDIMPTILDIAGISHTQEVAGRQVVPMQGRSVLDLLEGNVETPYAEASQVGYELFGLKASSTGIGRSCGCRTRLVVASGSFYNIKNDPGEMRNLGGEHPERLEQMVAMWSSTRPTTKSSTSLSISLKWSNETTERGIHEHGIAKVGVSSPTRSGSNGGCMVAGWGGQAPPWDAEDFLSDARR